MRDKINLETLKEIKTLELALLSLRDDLDKPFFLSPYYYFKYNDVSHFKKSGVFICFTFCYFISTAIYILVEKWLEYLDAPACSGFSRCNQMIDKELERRFTFSIISSTCFLVGSLVYYSYYLIDNQQLNKLQNDLQTVKSGNLSKKTNLLTFYKQIPLSYINKGERRLYKQTRAISISKLTAIIECVHSIIEQTTFKGENNPLLDIVIKIASHDQEMRTLLQIKHDGTISPKIKDLLSQIESDTKKSWADRVKSERFAKTDSKATDILTSAIAAASPSETHVLSLRSSSLWQTRVDNERSNESSSRTTETLTSSSIRAAAAAALPPETYVASSRSSSSIREL